MASTSNMSQPRPHITIAHPYARLFAKKDGKRRKIWPHTLEKSIFTPYELSTLGAPQRRTIYIASLEAHIDQLHNQLLQLGFWPVAFHELDPYKGLNSKTAKSMVAGLQHDTAQTKLKILELERSVSISLCLHRSSLHPRLSISVHSHPQSACIPCNPDCHLHSDVRLPERQHPQSPHGSRRPHPRPTPTPTPTPPPRSQPPLRRLHPSPTSTNPPRPFPVPPALRRYQPSLLHRQQSHVLGREQSDVPAVGRIRVVPDQQSSLSIPGCIWVAPS
ncbi:hypothetical protein HGRIS_007837 [Hohenbuehelia grisea]|uniref:Uncharacterized protein n=1 Tax=Hohenbuehelia grisea TaxID=104357 RepID=A0ABR3J7G5_9AGAR